MAKVIIDEIAYIASMKEMAKKFTNPTLMDQIVDHVASGGTIAKIAREMDVPYKTLIGWIRCDKLRSDRYDRALNDRNEAMIENILNALDSIQNFDIRDLYDGEGNMLPMRQWPSEARFCVNSIKPTEWGNELKLSDRLKAIELAGKHKAMFTERITHEAGKSLVDLIQESWENGSRTLLEKNKQEAE